GAGRAPPHRRQGPGRQRAGPPRRAPGGDLMLGLGRFTDDAVLALAALRRGDKSTLEALRKHHEAASAPYYVRPAEPAYLFRGRAATWGAVSRPTWSTGKTLDVRLRRGCFAASIARRGTVAVDLGHRHELPGSH